MWLKNLIETLNPKSIEDSIPNNTKAANSKHPKGFTFRCITGANKAANPIKAARQTEAEPPVRQT